MVKIIDSAKKYDSELFSSLQIELQNPQKYYTSIRGLFNQVKKVFPLLNVCILPTVKPFTAFIQGLLLPTYSIKEKYLDEEQYAEYGLPIFATIPEDYYTNGIRVYDACKRIIWENIPYEDRHCIPLEVKTDKAKRERFICTHNKKDVTKANCVIGVLNSAYHLFEEYRKLERTGKFDLECHPHSLRRSS